MSTQKLRVWHIPQVPGKPFHVHVPDLQTAKIVIDTLANYDLFQLENKIKPDYANSSGLEVFDEETNQWGDWYDEHTGWDFDEYCMDESNPE